MENISIKLNKVIKTMHSNPGTRDVQLGPTLTALVEVEGVDIEDTGSLVTLIQLESLLHILIKQQSPS